MAAPLERQNTRGRRAMRLACIALATCLWAPLQVPLSAAMSLTAVAPLGASAGVSVQITGNGFDPTAANNVVTLTPATGAAVQVTASSITTLDASKGLRRIGITIPAGIAVGQAAVRVTNVVTGESVGGRSIDIDALTLPATTSAIRGATQVSVRIDGSANASFVAGRTTVTMGAGVTVQTVQVTSAQSLIATVSIGATAALGPRTVLLVTSAQTAQLDNGFTVTAPNRAPVLTSTPPSTATAGQAMAYQATATDPDGDAVTFRLVSGPTGVVVAADGAVRWTPQTGDVGSRQIVIEASDGKGGATQQSFTVTVARANRPPAITSTPPSAATEGDVLAYQATATDPDGDPVTFRIVSGPSGATIASDGGLRWTPQSGDVGARQIVIEASDGRGGTAQQSFTVTVAAAVRLQSIQVDPAAVRFAAIGATRTLTVTGTRTDGSIVPLTTSASGTRYESTNAFVARADDNGVLTAIANGTATITARNGTLSATTSVQVESGVTLDSLELTPADSTIRAVGVEQPLTLRGRFSDGSLRDLTSEPGVTFESSDATVARVSSVGHVTAVAEGSATITARYDTASAAAHVAVSISTGRGFVRGEVYDDSRGLPLAGATVTLLEDGAGPVTPVVAVAVDTSGSFSLSAAVGAAVIRLSKAGFTSVDRRITVPANDAVTSLDARLTPVLPAAATIGSALGGEARDGAGRFRLQIPAGALTDDAPIVVTPLSGQGLPLPLPLGWSPVAAVAIGPASGVFAVPATLTLPNAAGDPAGAALPLARYNADRHLWIVEPAAVVEPSAQTVTAAVAQLGTYVLLRGDSGALPPAAGEALAGVTAATTLPPDASAAGEVVPRSAPPGDQARATGRITAIAHNPIPSGAIVHVRVQEQFDLLDQTHVITQPFVEDIVLYQSGAAAPSGSAGATFPITPSHSFTIQQLMLGVVRLAVAAGDDLPPVSVVGSGGGTVTDAEGDQLSIAAGALSADQPIAIRRLSGDEAAALTPAEADLIAAIRVDAIGLDLAIPATLTTAAPAGASGQDQFLLAAAFLDPFGQRRLRLVGLLDVVSGRLVPRALPGSNAVDGVRGGGDFFVLRAHTALGFVDGTVLRGGSPVAAALVTSTATAFADVTGATGHALLPSPAAATATLTAVDVPTGDRGSAAATVAAAALVPVSIAVSAPTFSLTASIPATGAIDVPLDASVTLDFSSPVDPSTVTASSIALRTTAGDASTGLVVSADRRRVTVRPLAPLASASTYTLSLGAAVRDAAGHALAPAIIRFATLDTTRPLGPSGHVTATLPDTDGDVLVSGGSGAAPARGAVTLTNVRTQESITVLALSDGSFQARVGAVIGDTLLLVIHGNDGTDESLEITQFQGPDGTAGIGPRGGTVTGPAGRTARLLPNSLAAPGLFRLSAADGTAPVLPDGFIVADAFGVDITLAVFNDLASLTLTDPQNRFAPQTASRVTFSLSAALPVPADALAHSSLRFTATAVDVAGTRRTADVSTTTVEVNADSSRVEGTHNTDFPSVFIGAPKQVVPGEQTTIDAIAPQARLEVRIPAPQGLAPGDTLWLTQAATIADEPRLVLVDRLDLDAATPAAVSTAGRELPGVHETGRYVVVRATTPLVLASGRIAGAPAIVEIDGLPFVFRTSGPDGSFAVPVRAGQPFTLHAVGIDGTTRGTITGTAPPSGSIDLGNPLSPTTGTLTVVPSLDDRSVVEIDNALVFRFSETADPKSVAPAVVVVDPSGSRVPGTVAVSADRLSATFTPLRRWHFATTYRYGVAASLVAASGARQALPLSGQFSTFTPTVLASVSQTAARDVSVNGSTVLVGAADGLAAIDWSNPAAPRLVGTTPVAGGVSAVGLAGTLVDREGSTVEGPIAIAASGSAASDGQLGLYQLPPGLAPHSIGLAQLTAVGPANVPAGVIPAAGTPRATVAAPDGRAFVAIEGVGVIAARLADAVPPDAANPGRAVAGRYPDAVQSVSGVALLGNRLLVAGAAGLAVVDAALGRIGGADTGGVAVAVDAAAGLPLDLNGNHTIETDREVLDVAVVAGADGSVQTYRLPPSGDPQLLSVVRLGSAASSVVVDPAERLAYVAAGARGVMIVDLDGAASVQPVDDNHDGVDDRIAGAIAVPGAALRTAIDHARGVAAVAGGNGGVTVVQVLPPRTFVQSFLRDPLQDRTGDEESIIDTRRALATDDGLRLVVNAASAGERLTLVIQETPDAGGSPLLTFDNGTTARDLVPGLNDIGMAIRQSNGIVGSRATLKVQTAAGRQLLALEVTLLAVQPASIEPDHLLITPSPAVIPAGRSTVQLSVAAVMEDGQLFNVTNASAGTTYASSDPRVATVDDNGLVRAAAGGSIVVRVANHGVSALVTVSVDAPPVIVALEPRNRSLTLVSPGLAVPLDVVARYSDGTVRDVRATSSTFRSSAPGIVEATADGRIVARAEGIAVVTVSNGTLHADIEVAVEFRGPTVLTGISLRPVTGAVRSDDPLARAEATLIGTGPLDGLTVTFTLTGTATRSGSLTTNVDGVGTIPLAPLNGRGTLTVTASVVNPADGTTMTASQVVQTDAGAGDVEPNDSVAAAGYLAFGHAVSGSLDGASDVRDVYELDSTTDGTAALRLSMAAAAPASLAISFLSADGRLLQHVSVTTPSSRVTQALAAGATYLQIESATAVTYTVAAAFTQAPVVVQGVSPAAGGPATPVVINGSGFSTDAGQNLVFFGGIAGRIVAATTTRLDVIVPANAIDGPIRVTVRGGQATGPVFTVGNPAPPPPIVIDGAPRHHRLHPALAVPVDTERLIVQFDPAASRTQVDAIAAQVGGTVVGALPEFNGYVFRFAGLTSLRALDALRQQLRGSPLVARVSYDVQREVFQSPMRFDALMGAIPYSDGQSHPVGLAAGVALVFDAILAIRSTPPFDVSLSGVSGSPLAPVNVAVVDTGFNPPEDMIATEFTDAQGAPVVHFISTEGVSSTAAGLLQPTLAYSDLGGHGTVVTSIIAAVNSGVAGAGGALNSLFAPGEPPYRVLAYQAGSNQDAVDDDAAFGALLDAGRRGIDIVNMSFGLTRATLADAAADSDTYKTYLQGMPNTLAVIAAGNDGVDAMFVAPANLSLQLDNVVTVGATEVLNNPGRRALFGTAKTVNGSFAGSPCDPSVRLTVNATNTTGFVAASNCGPAITIAAPGTEVFAIDPDGMGTVNGTSAAAPIVSSIAALLLAIRGATHLSPSDLKSLLVDTGDDLGLAWQPGSARQIDALGAVRAVLPTSQHEAVYVADRERDAVIALEIDPMTGKPRIPAVPDRVIPLTLTKGGVTLTAQNPLGLAMSPAGEQMYVLVRAFSPADLGDGIMVINTRSEHATDFIPLSGGGFPRVPSPIAPGAVSVRKFAPMVVSPDGYLLYVGANDSLVVINTIEGKVVRSYLDLPAVFRLRAESRPVFELGNRLHAIHQAIHDGIENKQRPGTEISALTLSPDGKTLYAAFMTGGGGGNQPGGIVPINVDLFKDEQSGVFGLQSDLTGYLTTSATLEMISPGNIGRGDEPFAVAVSHDNRYVYMFNGGYEQILAAGPEALGLARYGELVGGAGFGIAAETAGSAGIAGTLNAINASDSIGGALSNTMAHELLQQAQGGVGLMVAPGFTAAFDVANGGQESWLFPSEVVVGWNVRPPQNIATDADSGLIVTQFSQPEVFAKRPMAVAMNPGGGSGPLANTRALVAFGQSGNFGVLDLFSQGEFRRLTPPNAAFMALPTSMFQALVGVTPSVPVGPFTWPDRGTFASRDSGQIVPSPDEALLYASALVYAQNGRFAVAAHAGRDLPTVVDAQVPNFDTDPVHALQPLLALGFTYSGGSTIVAPDGSSYHPGDEISLERGGGAISLIDDMAIGRDLDAHTDATVSDENGRLRPYFSRIPICDTVAVQPGTDEPEPRCAIDAVKRVLSYNDGATPTRFSKPVGVAIQPYVMFETPRTGTHVSLDSPVHVTWRDTQIDGFKVLVLDTDQLDANGFATEVNALPAGGGTASLTPDQLQARAMAAEFGGLFKPAPNGPRQGHRYQVIVALFKGADEFSRASVEVRFDQPTGPVVPETLTLDPVILAIGNAPGSARVTATLHLPAAPDHDVTTQATYSLVGNLASGRAVAAAIQQKLLASLAPGQTQTMPFGIIPGATIDPTGRLSAPQPGLEVLIAADDGVTSRPTVVLAGFTVRTIALEPLAAENPTEHHTLGDEVALTFGKGTNAPLIIEPHDGRFIDDDGQIYLDDVLLQYAGGGTIHLNDLMDILRAAPGDLSIETPFQSAIRYNLSPLGATPTWRNTQALTDLLEGPDTPFLSNDLALTTSDAPAAFVLQGGFFSARIASNVAGLAVVTGTLDLGGFGKGVDGVLVWSLPPLDSARIDPATLTIRRTNAPTPGPSLRARASVTPTSAVLQTPPAFADNAAFLRETMPAEFAVGGAPIAVAKSGAFRFEMSGTATMSATGVEFSNMRVEFDVPNDRGPFTTVAYGIADTSIVGLGDSDAFEQHVVHQNAAGSTAVTVDVTIDGMGSARGTGQVTVCDCSEPAVIALPSSAAASPGLATMLPEDMTGRPASSRAPPAPPAEAPRRGAQR